MMLKASRARQAQAARLQGLFILSCWDAKIFTTEDTEDAEERNVKF